MTICTDFKEAWTKKLDPTEIERSYTRQQAEMNSHTEDVNTRLVSAVQCERVSLRCQYLTCHHIMTGMSYDNEGYLGVSKRPFDFHKARKTFLLFFQDLLLIEQKVLQGIEFLARLDKTSEELPCVKILARKIL